MPKVPETRIAGVGPRPLAAGIIPIRDAVAPLALGAEFVREQEERFAAIQAQENADKRAILFSEKKSEFVRAFADLQREAEETDDIEGITANFDAGAEEAMEGIFASVEDEIVSQELQRFAIENLTPKRIAIEGTQRQRRADKSLAALPGELDTYRDAIATAKTEAEREQLKMAAHETIGINPYLSEEQQAGLQLDWDRSIASDDLERMREAAPGDLFRLAGDPGAFHERFPSLTEDERVEVRGKIKAEIGSRAQADMRVRISRAESITELNAEASRADALRRDDFISDDAWATFQIAIDRQKEEVEEATGMRTIYDAAMSGPGNYPLNPDSPETKKLLEAGYESDIEGAEPEAILDHELLIARNTGTLPPQVFDRQMAVTSTGSPAAIAQEAEQYARIKQASSLAASRVPKQARTVLEAVSNAVKFGTPAAEALEQVRKEQAMGDAERKVARERLANERLNKSDEAWLQEKLGERDFAFDIEPFLSPMLSGVFSTRVNAEYMSNPRAGADHARQMVLNDMQQEVGTYKIGDREEVMWHPPDKMYLEAGGDVEGINKQLAEELVEFLPEVPEVVRERILAAGTDSDDQLEAVLENVSLRSDFLTPREIGPRNFIDPKTGIVTEIQNQPRPGYQVWWRDPNDPAVEIQIPGLRFYPDPTKTEKGRAQSQAIFDEREHNARRREIVAENRVVRQRFESHGIAPVSEQLLGSPIGLFGKALIEGATVKRPGPFPTLSGDGN